MRPAAPDVPLTVNVPDLDHFVREKPEILKRFLLSCPDWAARDIWKSGQMFSKQDETIEVRMPFGTGGGEEIWHPEYNFRFSKEAPIAHGVRAPVNVAAPTLGTLRVKLTQDKNTFNSTVAIGSEGLWFEFFERTNVPERRQTEAALIWLSTFLASVRAHEHEIEEDGFAPGLTPANNVKRGAPSFAIETEALSPEEAVDNASCHKIDAWLNPGEEGAVYVQAFNESAGKKMGPLDRTRRFIGWSKNPRTLFRYQESFCVQEGASYDRYKARFELWFHPAHDGPDRKLFEKSFELQGWHS